MTEFEVFKSFYSAEEAQTFQELLTRNGIACKVEKTKIYIDKVIIGDSGDMDVHLKLEPKDFGAANEILDKYIRENISDIDEEYYLYSFSTEELLDILKKPDEWSNQDVIIAKKILEDRGGELPGKQVENLKTERLNQLAQPGKASGEQLILGYLLAVFFCIFGLFYALYLLNSTKILPDGHKVLSYNKETRDHFRVMAIIAGALVAGLALAGVSRVF